MATKCQSNPKSQNTCKFGHAHSWFSPIYRDGKLAAPNSDWAECATCGRIEDEDGKPVVDVPFARFA
jgi:hypothetical protein